MKQYFPMNVIMRIILFKRTDNSLKPHLHGRLFCVRFFDKNGCGKVAFTQRRF